MVKKNDIVNIAFRLFASKGFHETTMENIADGLGFKKQSIYSHFKSKNDIILAVLTQQAGQLSSEITRILAENGDKPAEMLLKFLFMHLSVFFSQRDRLLIWKRIFLLDPMSELKDMLDVTDWDFHRSLIMKLSRILRARYPKLVSQEKLEKFFQSYMIFIQGYLDWMIITGYDVNAIESAWDTYWDGCKTFFT